MKEKTIFSLKDNLEPDKNSEVAYWKKDIEILYKKLKRDLVDNYPNTKMDILRILNKYFKGVKKELDKKC